MSARYLPNERIQSDRCRRSACVVNGRLRHTGKDPVQHAPPCVVSRVGFYVLQTSSEREEHGTENRTFAEEVGRQVASGSSPGISAWACEIASSSTRLSLMRSDRVLDRDLPDARRREVLPALERTAEPLPRLH